MTRSISRIKTAIAGVAALFAVSTTALAADMPLPPPPAPPPALKPAIYDWSGVYVGVVGGIVPFDTTYVPIGNPDPELGATGIMFGGLVGYNVQWDNFVLGIEGDWAWASVKARNALDDVNYKINQVATARLRAGMAIDDTLLYITGGLAWMQGKMTLPAFAESTTKSHYGWTVGGGIEQAVSDSINLRLEYLYASFKKENYVFTPGTVRMGINNLHMVRAGLIWNLSPHL